MTKMRTQRKSYMSLGFRDVVWGAGDRFSEEGGKNNHSVNQTPPIFLCLSFPASISSFSCLYPTSPAAFAHNQLIRTALIASAIERSHGPQSQHFYLSRVPISISPCLYDTVWSSIRSLGFTSPPPPWIRTAAQYWRVLFLQSVTL